MRGLPSDRRVALGLFLAAASLYGAVMFGTTENPDAEVEYQTSRSLLEEGSLAMGDTPAARAIVEREFNVRRGVDGRAYSWFGVGRAALGVPFLAAGRLAAKVGPGLDSRLSGGERYGVPESEVLEHFAFAAMGPIAAAGCVAVVFLLARAIGAGAGAAFAAAALLGGTTYFLPHARSSLGDTTGAFFLWAALLFALRSPLRAGGVALACAAAGAAVATRPLSALALPPLLAQLALSCSRAGGRTAIPGVAILATIGGGLAWTNVSRFGSPFEFGYGAAVGSGSYFSFEPWLGLLGLLLSPGRGLLFYAPAVLLAIPGTRALFRDGKKGSAVVLLATVACVLLPPSFTEGWHGGHAYGPRYALPALGPLLALAAASLATPGVRRAGGILGLVGCLTCIPGVLAPYPEAIDRGVRIVETRFPEVPENVRFQYLLFHPRLAPPLLHLSLLGEVRARDQFGWLRLAGAEGYGFLAVVPILLLALAASLGVRAARRTRRGSGVHSRE